MLISTSRPLVWFSDHLCICPESIHAVLSVGFHMDLVACVPEVDNYIMACLFFFFLPWKPTCFLSYLFWFNLNFLHYLQEHNLHCIWAHLVIGLILICPFSSLSQIICIYEGGQRPLAYYCQCLNYLKKKKNLFLFTKKIFLSGNI